MGDTYYYPINLSSLEDVSDLLNITVSCLMEEIANQEDDLDFF